MFQLECGPMSLDRDLQIVQADLRLEIDGELVINEPLCIDVGLPALLESALRDTTPNRWAGVSEWKRVPFFVCGCGDPECRAYSFAVRHLNGGQVELSECEEPEEGQLKQIGQYMVGANLYREAVLRLAKNFLEFVRPLPYKPLLEQTVALVERLAEEVERELQLHS